jgi:hypothetical protein
MNETTDVYEDIKKEILPFESWERLAGESGMAYAAFCVYRDYGPERNIRKAVEGQFRNEECPPGQDRRIERKYRMWRLWSMQFKWVKRAEDYDGYLDRLKQTELRKTIEARGEAHREVTGKMLQMVNKKLDMMTPAELPQGAVTAWVETAVKTEREIFGLAVGKDKGETGQFAHANCLGVSTCRNSTRQGNITFTPEFEGL